MVLSVILGFSHSAFATQTLSDDYDRERERG